MVMLVYQRVCPIYPPSGVLPMKICFEKKHLHQILDKRWMTIPHTTMQKLSQTILEISRIHSTAFPSLRWQVKDPHFVGFQKAVPKVGVLNTE